MCTPITAPTTRSPISCSRNEPTYRIVLRDTHNLKVQENCKRFITIFRTPISFTTTNFHHSFPKHRPVALALCKIHWCNTRRNTISTHKPYCRAWLTARYTTMWTQNYNTYRNVHSNGFWGKKTFLDVHVFIETRLRLGKIIKMFETVICLLWLVFCVNCTRENCNKTTQFNDQYVFIVLRWTSY